MLLSSDKVSNPKLEETYMCLQQLNADCLKQMDELNGETRATLKGISNTGYLVSSTPRLSMKILLFLPNSIHPKLSVFHSSISLAAIKSTDLYSFLSPKLSILVYAGCYNKIPHTE